MGWLPVHPSSTAKVRLPDEEGGAVFEIGFWPPSVSERLSIKIEYIQENRKKVAGLDLVNDFDKILKSLEIGYETFQEMCRYGVRGWSEFGENVPTFEKETIDGLEHVCLTKESLNAVYVNGLMVALGMKVVLFNTLSEAEKKTSDWLSSRNSQTQVTSAQNATPISPSKTTASSPSK